MHTANDRAAGHLFNREVFERQIFDEHLEKQMADSTSGLTVKDRKIINLTKKIDKINSTLTGQRRVTKKTIDVLTFKLRKLNLLVDKEYRKSLNFQQRLRLDQIHQSILSDSLSNYVKDKGIEVIQYWDWSSVWRGTGTIWRNIITKWGLVEFLIFPKFNSASISPGLATYLAWYGLEHDPKYSGWSGLKKPISNRLTRAWHQLYVTGIISLISYLSYAMYDSAQMAKAELIASNLAAAESIAQVPDQMKKQWIEDRHKGLQASFVIKRHRQPTDIEVQELREYAEYLYAEAEAITAEDKSLE
jgi:hypothetical protein